MARKLTASERRRQAAFRKKNVAFTFFVPASKARKLRAASKRTGKPVATVARAKTLAYFKVA